MNVALYGFMGVGKSTVGKALSERLGYGFVDMDETIERRAGMRRGSGPWRKRSPGRWRRKTATS